MEELIQMSRKELNRIRVIEAVKQKQITQRAAGLKLGVSDPGPLHDKLFDS